MKMATEINVSFKTNNKQTKRSIKQHNRRELTKQIKTRSTSQKQIKKQNQNRNPNLCRKLPFDKCSGVTTDGSEANLMAPSSPMMMLRIADLPGGWYFLLI
jgi:hypothetical protein